MEKMYSNCLDTLYSIENNNSVIQQNSLIKDNIYFSKLEKMYNEWRKEIELNKTISGSFSNNLCEKIKNDILKDFRNVNVFEYPEIKELKIEIRCNDGCLQLHFTDGYMSIHQIKSLRIYNLT